MRRTEEQSPHDGIGRSYASHHVAKKFSRGEQQRERSGTAAGSNHCLCQTLPHLKCCDKLMLTSHDAGRVHVAMHCTENVPPVRRAAHKVQDVKRAVSRLISQ